MELCDHRSYEHGVGPNDLPCHAPGKVETVTHPDDGQVWAPVEKLGMLIGIAVDIDGRARKLLAVSRLDESRELHTIANRLRQAIGAPIQPL